MVAIKDHLHEVDDADDPVIPASLPVTAQAAFVDPETATAEQIAQALIDAGLMAAE